MSVEQYFFTMRDGTECAVYRWMPAGDVQGVVHISHGMVEHAMRYAELGERLASLGFVCIAHDHRGHGLTGTRAEEKHTGCMGKLAASDGFRCVTDDLKELIDHSKTEFTGKSIFLIGHSFGSFVAQNFIELYGDSITGCVLMGTAGPRPVTIGMGKAFVSFLSLFLGNDVRSKLVNYITFGSYNARVCHSLHEHDWLSRDMTEVAAYEHDSYCGFIPTVSFFKDLLQGLATIHTHKALHAIPRDLPLLVLYGSADPVGGYGVTVGRLLEMYKRLGLEHIESVCYSDARHELLHETNKTEVIDCVLDWIIKNK